MPYFNYMEKGLYGTKSTTIILYDQQEKLYIKEISYNKSKEETFF